MRRYVLTGDLRTCKMCSSISVCLLIYLSKWTTFIDFIIFYSPIQLLLQVSVCWTYLLETWSNVSTIQRCGTSVRHLPATGGRLSGHSLVSDWSAGHRRLRDAQLKCPLQTETTQSQHCLVVGSCRRRVLRYRRTAVSYNRPTSHRTVTVSCIIVISLNFRTTRFSAFYNDNNHD